MKSVRLFYWIFFLSGATGLVYEIIWVRLTGLVFGNTAHAISTVLGAFMAGLALGSWKLGNVADQVRRPLRMYGLLEIGIGLSAALVPVAFGALETAYWSVAPSLASIPGADSFVRFSVSFLVLLLPTFLMGGTLPVLSRFFTRDLREVEKRVGLLYALNTFGAAAGTLAAALYLIPQFGSLRTTLFVAALNIAIGLFSIWLDASDWGQARVSPGTGSEDLGEFEGRTPNSSAEEFGVRPSNSDIRACPQVPETASRTNRLVLATLVISGFVSMVYEVAWTRALTAMIGSSTYAFSIMLVTFLIGIALGSSLISRFRPPASVRTLGLVQLGVAIGGIVFLVGYVAAPYILISVIRALFYSFPAVLTTQFLMSAMLMILATLGMGATFPLAGQIYSSKYKVLGRSIGNIYSVNTIGAIAGSLVAGFVLLPLIGTERTILTGLFCSSAIAIVLLTEDPARRPYAKGTAIALLLVATLTMGGGFFWNPELLDRGILIYAQRFNARPELSIAEQYADTDLVYFKEGNNATISVRRGENYTGLRTNGKVDASNREDMATQLIIAYLAGFSHPAPKSAMIIGYGSGATVGAVSLFDGIEKIDCLEIEPAVVGAGPWFSDINRKSYENPKVHMIYNDARNYMNITREQYDVIISEPSNPWIAGVASLFTAEFYERAAQVLKPGGVFAQWIQLYQLDPEDLRMIMHEFQRIFPEVSAWISGAGDLVLIGTMQPQRFDVGRVQAMSAANPDIVRDFREFMKTSDPSGILAYYVMSSEEVRKFSETRRRNTDDHPVLEFAAPRQLFTETGGLNVDLLYDGRKEIMPTGVQLGDAERTYGAMIEPLLALRRTDDAAKAMELLAGVDRDEEGTLHLAMARLDLDSGNLEKARISLEEAAATPSKSSKLTGDLEELRGTLADRTGDSDAAMDHFKRAASAEPDSPVPLRRLSELSAQKELWSDAASWMEQFIETRPPSLGHYWAVLGDYRIAAEEPEEAVQALQKALEIDPYVYLARYRLARLFEDRKEVKDAMEQYEFVLKYAFDRDPEVYIKLANLYQAEGNSDRALAILEKGSRIFPTNVPIHRLYREMRGLE